MPPAGGGFTTRKAKLSGLLGLFVALMLGLFWAALSDDPVVIGDAGRM
jgi:hypothetical protein